MKTLSRVTLVLVALLALPALAVAQTVVVNPTTVSFDPSPDHAAVGLDGAALVTSYSLRFYAEGAGSPTQTQDLGKPAPGTDGRITIANRALFAGAPLSLNTKYVAKVATVGPTGVAESDPSNPFGNAGPPRKGSAPTVR